MYHFFDHFPADQEMTTPFPGISQGIQSDKSLMHGPVQNKSRKTTGYHLKTRMVLLGVRPSQCPPKQHLYPLIKRLHDLRGKAVRDRRHTPRVRDKNAIGLKSLRLQTEVEKLSEEFLQGRQGLLGRKFRVPRHFEQSAAPVMYHSLEQIFF